MKKLLIMLAAMLPLFAFVGCSDDENSNGEDKNGTYCVVNNNEKFETELDDTLNGTMYEVIAFEYDESGDLISQKNIGDVSYGGGRSDIIEADETCVKVQISFLNIQIDAIEKALLEEREVEKEIPVVTDHQEARRKYQRDMLAFIQESRRVLNQGGTLPVMPDIRDYEETKEKRAYREHVMKEIEEEAKGYGMTV